MCTLRSDAADKGGKIIAVEVARLGSGVYTGVAEGAKVAPAVTRTALQLFTVTNARCG